ncbi:MAG: hypothetical protein JXL80_03680 [Planctomycetes bacterium]|nr:hypothetical protein [Planctomycetota bacterium]
MTCRTRMSVAVVVLGALTVGTASAAGPKTWNDAARDAARQRKLVLAVYSESKPGQSADEVVASPMATTLSHMDVRPLVKRYCVLANLRTGDDDSGWKTFQSQKNPVVFAMPDGTFLQGLATNATPEQFIDALKLALKQAREIGKGGDDKAEDGAAGQAGQPAAAGKADSSADAVAVLKEAEALAAKGDYPEAVERVKAVLDAAEADSPDARRAERVAKSLTQEAEKIVKQAESLLAAKKPIAAFRQFDEVAHLFAGLPVADEAAKRLDEVLGQPIMEDYAAEYREERVVYDLFERAMGLFDNEFWKDAAEKFQEIADKYPRSPVAVRAAQRADYCRKQNVAPPQPVAE